jgi:hypothetical protein
MIAVPAAMVNPTASRAIATHQKGLLRIGI